MEAFVEEVINETMGTSHRKWALLLVAMFVGRHGGGPLADPPVRRDPNRRRPRPRSSRVGRSRAGNARHLGAQQQRSRPTASVMPSG